MAFNQGYNRRAKRPVNVLRGFEGNDPKSFTKNYPVLNGATIHSGQVVSLSTSGGVVGWVLGAPEGKVPYIALSDSYDTDVRASDLLPALSCAGKFEIETGYYVAGTYSAVNNTPLTAGTSGNVGSLQPATAGDALTPTESLIGFITVADTDPNSVSGYNAAYGSGMPGPYVENTATDSSYITFITNWIPARETT